MAEQIRIAVGSVEVEYTVDPGEFGKINGTILRVTRRK
jgi:hypothetical protein